MESFTLSFFEAFIRENWKTATDGQIASVFGVTKDSVTLARKRMGLKRHRGGNHVVGNI